MWVTLLSRNERVDPGHRPRECHSLEILTRRDERYAIVHDHLVQRGGAERVVASMGRILDAEIRTSFFNPQATHPDVAEQRIRPSLLDRITWFRSNHRWAFPILAPLFAAMRPRAEVTVLSTIGWAHFARPRGRAVAYWHAPARWLYQSDIYIGTSGKGRAVRMLVPTLRWFDHRAAGRIDLHIANSTAIANRVANIYGVDVETIHPPITFAGSPKPMTGIKPGFLLVVSRLIGYKNIDVIIEAMKQLPDHRLVIAGGGPNEDRLRELAGDRISFVGQPTDDQLAWLYQEAIGVVTAAHEDFGLTPLEAAMFGTPTAALRAGGFLDTIIEGSTGVFIEDVEPAAVADAVIQMEAIIWEPETLAKHAESFSEEVFAQKLKSALADKALPRNPKTQPNARCSSEPLGHDPCLDRPEPMGRLSRAIAPVEP